MYDTIIAQTPRIKHGDVPEIMIYAPIDSFMLNTLISSIVGYNKSVTMTDKGDIIVCESNGKKFIIVSSFETCAEKMKKLLDMSR